MKGVTYGLALLPPVHCRSASILARDHARGNRSHHARTCRGAVEGFVVASGGTRYVAWPHQAHRTHRARNSPAGLICRPVTLDRPLRRLIGFALSWRHAREHVRRWRSCGNGSRSARQRRIGESTSGNRSAAFASPRRVAQCVTPSLIPTGSHYCRSASICRLRCDRDITQPLFGCPRGA